MGETKRILVAGAAGKVGQAFIRRFLSDPRFEAWKVRALCHNRMLAPTARMEVVRGSIENRAVVDEALEGVTHVLHLATCKETPESIMDVAIKGMFWLLEACRVSPTFEQFILIGGDAGMGHFFYPHPVPVTEAQKHSAYPGCYALSKVLEEVMLEQYYIQYAMNGCCLRAPWIMEKDDFKAQLSFGDDVFGGPRWRDLVGAEAAEGYIRSGAVPVMLDPDGEPVKRNFVHVEDLVAAILKAIDHEKARQQTFNICMDEPVDYGELARYLESTRSLPSVKVKTPYRSTWLDNTKAKFLLGWRPHYDLARLTDAAFDYVRAPDDPRITWYPG
ncbi:MULTISPECIES: NAD(P)-dependent oxidoreductase [Sorangium]|uniref:UDP-glucose 4-epimerase n=1 Tax=Sorangium cellulosum TaxID=56 RepID=A0A4P2R7A7_SORCE|nr:MULTISPECIES: NAD(P)-dependent oxidoreductase [Sorangium]AUX37943.1 UDP-glucose 4-epimerase [Sorangium cellulosum]WCQ97230.1 nucleotide-sugar epimerase [Sorangium sp. Soce836]